MLKKFCTAALEQLVESDSHSKIKSLIGDTPPRSIIDNDGTTLLHFSSKSNNLKITKLLIDLGCDVNAKNLSDATPLMFAVNFNQLEVTRLLLDNHADMLAINSEGQSALHLLLKITVSNTRIAFLKCFIERMQKIEWDIIDIAKSLGKAGCSLADIVCIYDTQLLKAFLLENSLHTMDSYRSMYNAMTTFKMQQVRTLLMYGPLFKKRRIYFLKCVLKMSSNLKILEEAFAREIIQWNVLSKNEISMIEHILKRANEKSMRILLASGIISHVKKHGDGRDVFVHIFGNPCAVDLMKNCKFDVNSRGFNGQTALHVAVANKLVRNVQFLLERGADPNAKDDDGETPIFEVLWSIKNPGLGMKCVEVLLLNGADVQACDYGGVSFVYYAARANVSMDLLELVLSYLVVQEAKGLKIERLIIDQIAVRERSRRLFDECRVRLEETKTREVCDGVTMFEMITDRVGRRVNVMDCKRIADFLGGRKDCWGFYDEIVRDRMNKIERMIDLRWKARIFICQSIRALEPYDLVIDHIVNYFNYEDLIVFE